MVNRVTLVGRLGQDVELKYTPTGIPFARLSVATNSTYKNKDGQPVDKTDWHRVIVFQKTAENCANYLGKGSLVYLEGRLSTRKWVDQEGVERYVTEITAKRVQFLDRRRDEEQPLEKMPEQLQTEGSDSMYPTVDQVPY